MSSLNVVLIALFFFVSVLGCIILKKPERWKAILITSIIFYFFLIGFKILIILYLAFITFLSGTYIYQKRIRIFWPIVLTIIPFIVSNAVIANDHFNNFQLENLGMLEPNNWTTFFQLLGLSYISFNCISYLVDIKRGYIIAEKNFFRLLLYLTFFPLVFSGPLHRYKYLSKEFGNIEISDESISRGLRLVLLGLFKMMISQRLFRLVLLLEGSLIAGIYYLFVGFLFFIFLYFSFSSFIDFFQGLSQMYGIKVKSNFKNRIYFATSRQEFWKGWHITLNEWFRDYFFFPLAKREKKRKYTDAFLLVTFLCIALWHGFTSSLIIWGFVNGIWIILEKKITIINGINGVIKKIAGFIYHISLSSMLALIFISTDFIGLIKRLSAEPKFPNQFIHQHGVNILIILICFLIVDYHYSQAKEKRFDEYLNSKPMYYRWFVYLKFALILLVFGIDWNIDNYYNQF